MPSNYQDCLSLWIRDIIIFLKKLDGAFMKYIDVMYGGKEYLLLFEYDSGYCEIQEKNNQNNIKLVHSTQLKNSPAISLKI